MNNMMNNPDLSNPPIPQNPEEYLNFLLLLLETTYKSSDNALRKQAEKNLNNARASLIPNIGFLISSITTRNLQKELSNSLLIYIRNTIVSFKTKKNSPLTREVILNIIRIVVNTIIDKTFQKSCLKEMNKIFEEIIDTNVVEEDFSILSELLNLIRTKISSNLLDISTYGGTGYMLENILCCTCVNENNSKEVIDIELSCANDMLSILTNSITSLNPNDDLIISNIFDNIKVIFGLLLNISVHSQKTFKNAELFKEKLFNFFSYATKFTVDLSYIDSKFNALKMKTKIFRFASSLIPLYSSFIEKTLLDYNTKLVMFAINEISSQYGKINCDIADVYFEQMINYLWKIAFTPSFKFEFEKVINEFTVKALVPMLVSSDKERLDIVDDSNSYAIFMYNCVQTRKEKGIKGIIAKFIHSACGKANGYLTFITKCGMDLVEGMKESNVEVGLFILSVVFDRILKENDKPNYIKIIADFLYRNFTELVKVSTNAPIVKERLCLFISVYIDEFITLSAISLDFLSSITQMLFENIFSFIEDGEVSLNNTVGKYESLEAVKAIVTNKTLEKSALISTYRNSFISATKKETNPIFFDILTEISPSFEEGDLLHLLQILFARVVAEITPRRLSHQSANEMQIERRLNDDYKIIINKCFNVILSILNNNCKVFIEKNFEAVEEMVSPLICYMKYPNKIEFSDDIILTMTILIQTIEKIPNIALKLLPDLNQYLRKNHGMTLSLFELLNEYIIHSNNVIEQSEDYSKSLFKLFKKSYAKEAYEKSAFIGAVFIQIWIMNSKEINPKLVTEILSFAFDQESKFLLCEKSNHSDVSLMKPSVQYTSLATIALMLAGFVNYGVVAYNSLNFEMVIKFLRYQMGYNAYSQYELKICVISFCAIMQNETLRSNYPSIVSQALYWGFILLKKIKKHEAKKLKEKEKAKVKVNVVSDSESEEEEEYEEENFQEEDLLEYNEIEHRAKSKFNSVDEFGLYKESVEILRNVNAMFINKFTDDLEDNEEKDFRSILSTKRVNVGNEAVPRKIIKLKKNGINKDG